MRGEDMLKRWGCKSRATRYNKKLYSSGRKILGLCFGIWISVYRVGRKRQFCKTRRPFLCYKSTRLCSTAWLPFGLPHCKHLDTFEFLCVVQVKRNIVLHTQGPHSHILMTGGSDRGSYFIPKKIPTSEFVYPKISLSVFASANFIIYLLES